jgi:hypothetical protein
MSIKRSDPGGRMYSIRDLTKISINSFTTSKTIIRREVFQALNHRLSRRARMDAARKWSRKSI